MPYGWEEMPSRAISAFQGGFNTGYGIEQDKRARARQEAMDRIAAGERQAKEEERLFGRRKELGFEGATDPSEMAFAERMKRKESSEIAKENAQAEYYSRMPKGDRENSVPALKAILADLDAKAEENGLTKEGLAYRQRVVSALAKTADVQEPSGDIYEQPSKFPTVGAMAGGAAGGMAGLMGGPLLGAAGALGGAGLGALAQKMYQRRKPEAPSEKKWKKYE